MSGVYSMTSGPSYTGASRQDLFDSAMAQPLSLTSTLVDQAKGGILESFGLGTAIRNLVTPEGNTQGSVAEPLYGMAAIPIPGAYSLLKTGVQSMMDQGTPLTEDAYKGSASYRKDIPWDQGMTDTRAASLAAADDAKKVREYYATKRPFSSFIGAMAGQALDPVNYVPVFGEAVTAAAIGRFGYIGGRALVAGADAALNTGIAGAVTAGERGKFGDDVSWQGLISQMATAALIGGAFGTLHGVFGSHVDPHAMSEAESRLSTLRTTQEARIALNEGIDAVAHGEDIKLSPNATEPMARVAGDLAKIDMPVKAQEVAQTIPQAEADATLASVGHDIKQLEAKGVDTATVLRSASPEEAARVAQTEEIATLREQIAAAVNEQPTATDPNAPAAAAPIAPEAKIAQVAAMADRLKTLEEHTAKGEVAPDLVKAVEDQRKAMPAPEQKPATPQEAQAAAAKVSAPRAIDTTPARPEPPPEGIKQAEASIAKPEDTKSLAEQYRVDPKTGTFPEEADLHQLSAEGRFTEEDASTMAEAQTDYETGSAFAEALKSVAGCLI